MSEPYWSIFRSYDRGLDCCRDGSWQWLEICVAQNGRAICRKVDRISFQNLVRKTTENRENSRADNGADNRTSNRTGTGLITGEKRGGKSGSRDGKIGRILEKPRNSSLLFFHYQEEPLIIFFAEHIFLPSRHVEPRTMREEKCAAPSYHPLRTSGDGSWN
jgi:hypothetical protein